MEMLNNQARKCLVKTYEKFKDAKEVAEAFGVTQWTVYRLAKQMERTGSVDLQTSTRGRKPKLSASDKEEIKKLLIEEPDLTIDEIQMRLELDSSVTTIWRAINELGFSRKKR